MKTILPLRCKVYSIRILTIASLECLFFNESISAQLTVQGGMTPAQLVDTLLGPGVTVSNVVYNGISYASGVFNGSSSNIGIGRGVLITSGDIYYAPGPNFTTAGGWDNFLPGDPDLDVLAGTFTYDATTLEFDFTIPSDTLKFRYVFASEEYNEYVCADYNDVFGFFISGPGIPGTQNIALLPGSGLPVAINNVNNGTMGIYGGTAACYFSNTGYYIDNENPPGATIEYDGFTTVLQAVAAVIPYQTYHIKLAVADATDYSLDSGVFIEAESFTGLPLPVELLSFVAEMRNNIVELKWTTASEQNSSHFDVQRSADGHNFEFVNRVEAAGNSNTAHSYHSVDYKPLQSEAY